MEWNEVGWNWMAPVGFRKFMKNFNFSSNVKLNIVLRKFDEEWDSFVDLLS